MSENATRSRVDKVFACVVREASDGSRELLIIDQQAHPEGPPQLPKGGLDPGEEPLAGALRELREETGLTSVEVLRPLDCMEVDDPYVANKAVEPQRWHLWLARPTTELPDEWSHRVSGDGEDSGMTFRCHWLALDSRAHEIIHPLFGPLVRMLRELC